MLLNSLTPFNLEEITLTKYLFFTGKGGVGKTSIASAVAVSLADKSKNVLLISTDPASNLQDVFGMKLNGKGNIMPELPSLTVVNLNPEEAAKEYRESVISPYRGKLPETVISSMEEQLSGSCTVEIAAFDQFSKFITDNKTSTNFDYIIFDTAPTGHTLRMLQLPSAWNDFISQNTHGTSCLGQLSGLEDKKEIYRNAVINLSDVKKTTILLVAKPEKTSLLELERTSQELLNLNIMNQKIIINGTMESGTDLLSETIYKNQYETLNSMPKNIKKFETYFIPLRAYNIMGMDKIRAFFSDNKTSNKTGNKTYGCDLPLLKTIQDLINDIYISKKKVVFTMGKGGVGKTSVAIAIAKGLAEKGLEVLLTTTDPANHLKYEKGCSKNIEISCIDEKKELQKYSEEVLSKARETMNEDNIAYIKEDLKSPCTQEIAIFRAFAEIVDKSNEKVVVIDTAPTGHTLLLLDSTLSYHKEVQRTKGEIPLSIRNLLPKLRDDTKTEVVIVTLPEATPVFEAIRLKKDLERAGIHNKWWAINKSLLLSNTTDSFLNNIAKNERKWIKKVSEISDSYAIIPFNENFL